MNKLNINDIKPSPFQPRRNFESEKLWELAKSIREHGIIEPLIVRVNKDGLYELIAGERRLRAAKLAGLDSVPVILKEYSDRQAAQAALIENIQRSDLNALEEAEAYRLLMDKFTMTQQDVARKAGKSRPHVANHLRLLKLPPKVRLLLQQNLLSMGQAKPLLSIDDTALQERAAQIIADKKLSARQAEKLIKQLQKDDKALERIGKEFDAGQTDIYTQDAIQKLKQALGTNVSIKRGRKKSRLEIEFYSVEELYDLVEMLSIRQRDNSSKKKIDFTI